VFLGLKSWPNVFLSVEYPLSGKAPLNYINYLINYPNLHIVQIEQTEVFLNAMSYHSKVAMGLLNQAPYRAPKAPNSFGFGSV
jgi:hypothetical protein